MQLRTIASETLKYIIKYLKNCHRSKCVFVPWANSCNINWKTVIWYKKLSVGHFTIFEDMFLYFIFYVSPPKLLWLVGLFLLLPLIEHRASVKRFVSLQFLNLRHSIGLLGRLISESQDRYLIQTQNKHKETSMPRVGFEQRSQRSSERRQFIL
jgi:hypothetical protein